MSRTSHFGCFFVRALTALVCLVISFSAFSARSDADDGVVMVCLNIGKADCILIRGADSAFLIDTGHEQNWPAVRTMLEQYGVTRLDGVFLTHCHKDHYGSLERLAQSDIEVDAWYASRIFGDTDLSDHPMVLAAGIRGREVNWLKSGDAVPAGEGASFAVLGPLNVDAENENNNSLVMRYECAYGSVLLCGDMKEAEENSLLGAGLIRPCDILKCGHHGDGGATTKALLNAARPGFALISTATGEEPDTPSPKTLNRLYSVGAKVFVTQDFRDAVEFRLGPSGISVKDAAWESVPARESGLSMRIDLNNDVLFITGAPDQDILIENAVLYSSKGTQLFSFGSLTIPAGVTVAVGSGASEIPCDLYTGSKKRVWHKSKLDVAILYDQWGRPLCFADNGMPE